jgi:hypothetical protein
MNRLRATPIVAAALALAACVLLAAAAPAQTPPPLDDFNRPENLLSGGGPWGQRRNGTPTIDVAIPAGSTAADSSLTLPDGDDTRTRQPARKLESQIEATPDPAVPGGHRIPRFPNIRLG